MDLRNLSGKPINVSVADSAVTRENSGSF